MKISSIKQETSYLMAKPKGAAPERTREKSVHYGTDLKLNNYKINTTIKDNSDGRVSFKGAPPLHKLSNFVQASPMTAEAIFAILITCIMRPAVIMGTAKTEEDKDKCAYQAAKSMSSGLVGLGTTFVVANPLKNVVKKVKENGSFNLPDSVKSKNQEVVQKGIEALNSVKDKVTSKVDIGALTADGKFNLGVFEEKGEKSFKNFVRTLQQDAPNVKDDIMKGIKAQKSNNNYSSTAKNIMDKFIQPAFLPIRASITIALVPIILKCLGLKKGGKAKAQQPQQPQQQQNNIYSTLNSGLKAEKEKEIFKSFLEVANNENK